MTEKESGDILLKAFVMFPGVSAWLKANSPEPEETAKIWAKSLEPFTTDEVQSVLDRWCSGQLPVPTGYEKENFHLHIRAVVMNDRTIRNRESTREETLKQHRRTSVFQSVPILGPYMARVMAVKREYDGGTITAEDRDERIEFLKNQAISNIERQSQ
jgi:hypothetical protein